MAKQAKSTASVLVAIQDDWSVTIWDPWDSGVLLGIKCAYHTYCDCGRVIQSDPSSSSAAREIYFRRSLHIALMTQVLPTDKGVTNHRVDVRVSSARGMGEIGLV